MDIIFGILNFRTKVRNMLLKYNLILVNLPLTVQWRVNQVCLTVEKKLVGEADRSFEIHPEIRDSAQNIQFPNIEDVRIALIPYNLAEYGPVPQ